MIKMKKDIIYNKDCLEGLKEIPDNSIDLIITDPPYELDSNGGGHSKLLKNRAEKLANSLSEIRDGFDVETHLNEWQRVCKKVNFFIFCSNKQITKLMQWGESRGFVTTLLVWHKTNATPFCNGTWQSDLEFVVHIREPGATFKGGVKLKSKCYRSGIKQSEYGHPTEKPIMILHKYLEIGSEEKDIILDPFAGSGSIAEACLNKDRHFIGFEISEEYHKMCMERIKKNNNKRLKQWF